MASRTKPPSTSTAAPGTRPSGSTGANKSVAGKPTGSASPIGPPTAAGAGADAAGGPTKGALPRKVLIMGARSVGKTSLINQYLSNNFNESYYPTIESSHRKEIVFDGVTYDCEIIDTAGQDEYSLFNHKYAIGVHGYILAYSIASRVTFDMIKVLHDKIMDQGVEKVCCVIVGNKEDMDSHRGKRQVSTEEGEALAKELGASFIETSALQNRNITDCFTLLMKDMKKTYNPDPERKKKSSWWSWGG